MTKKRARIARAALCGLASGALALASGRASAGAWTEPQGEGLAIATLFGWAGVGAPFGGSGGARESKFGAQAYVEYGLYDPLTVFGALSADRFGVAGASRDVFGGLDYSGAGLRARLWSNDTWVVSIEAAGYVSGARDASRAAQNGSTGPEADARALLGHGFTLFGHPAFFDAEAGYRLRTAGPPGEVHVDLTFGVDWTERIKLLLQSSNTVSDAAGSPGFPAWESHVAEVSLVYSLDPRWSLQVGGFGTLFCRNTNSQYGGLVAVWRRF